MWDEDDAIQLIERLTQDISKANSLGAPQILYRVEDIAVGFIAEFS